MRCGAVQAATREPGGTGEGRECGEDKGIRSNKRTIILKRAGGHGKPLPSDRTSGTGMDDQGSPAPRAPTVGARDKSSPVDSASGRREEPRRCALHVPVSTSEAENLSLASCFVPDVDVG